MEHKYDYAKISRFWRLYTGRDFSTEQCAIMVHLVEAAKEGKPMPDDWNRPQVQKNNDPVNNPSHYTHGGIECIDALQAALSPEEFKGFCRGNALKYAWRAPYKGKPEQDMEKARWYEAKYIEACRVNHD